MKSSTRKRKDKRSHILEATEALFKDRRIDEVTLDEVAERAGVGKGTIYLYFSDKNDLFLNMITESLERVRDNLEALASSSSGAEKKLRAMAALMDKEFYKHHAMIRLMHSPDVFMRNPESKDVMHSHMTAVAKTIESVVRGGQQERCFRQDINLKSASCLFIGGLISRNRREKMGGDSIPLQDVVDLFIRGVSVAHPNLEKEI